MPRAAQVLLAAAIAAAPPSFAAAQPKGDQNVTQLFATTCGWCHEEGGRVAGKGPKLAGTTRSDAFIIDRIKHGKEGAMPAFEGNLTSAQIRAIVRYIRGLKSE